MCHTDFRRRLLLMLWHRLPECGVHIAAVCRSHSPSIHREHHTGFTYFNNNINNWSVYIHPQTGRMHNQPEQDA